MESSILKYMNLQFVYFAGFFMSIFCALLNGLNSKNTQRTMSACQASSLFFDNNKLVLTKNSKYLILITCSAL